MRRPLSSGTRGDFLVASAPPSRVCADRHTGENHEMGIARKAALATLVVIAIVVLAIALWKLRVLISLFFLGLVIAAAMRPGIDWLHERRVPRGIGLAIHYLIVAVVFG